MTLFKNHYRHIILLVGLLCLTSLASNHITWTFTIICMENESHYNYDTFENALINWGVAVGTICGAFPFHWAYMKFDAKVPFLVSGIISIVSTALIPLAADSIYFLVALRFLQGFAYSSSFTIIGLISMKWSPLSELTIFLGTLTSYVGIAPTITNSVGGLVCESLGWRWVFYLHAIAGVTLFGVWSILYVENPENTKRVSEEELLKIKKDKVQQDTKNKIPYAKIITSPVILVVWLNAFTIVSMFSFFTFYMPVYYKSVLKYSIKETGILTAVSIGFAIPIRILAAIIFDKLTMFPERLKIIVYNLFSIGFVGLVVSLIGFVENRTLVFILCLIAFSVSACNCGSYYKCAERHSLQYYPFVISVIQFMKCVALFTCIGIYALFVSDNENRVKWIPAFLTLGMANILVASLSIFVLTDKPAEWTKIEKPSPHIDFSQFDTL